MFRLIEKGFRTPGLMPKRALDVFDSKVFKSIQSYYKQLQIKCQIIVILGYNRDLYVMHIIRITCKQSNIILLITCHCKIIVPELP